uniref:Coiled-coil domain containing 24 n=2 Tax=Takifugu rubripes TaxID=31033 RepID=A0A3B5KNK7_TAKRU
MQSPDETQLCWPSQSLWSLIAEHVPGSELPKIRTALGNSLVDMYIDLYAEAEMWESLSAQRGPGRGGGAAPRPPQLADPPAIKELVRAEVKMLLQTLRERSSAGRSSEDMVFHYEPAVVDYVLGDSGGSSSKNAVHETRSWSRCSVRSTAADEIEAVRDKLNIANIGQVVDRLKSVLAEECRALNKLLKHLKDDIKQRCKSQSGKQEPTLQDLKDLRGAVQKDLRLFSCSQAASRPTWSAVNQKVSQTRFRLPTLQTSSAETLPALNAVIKPRPAPPLCPAGPRPPAIPPGSRVRRRSISSAAHRYVHLSWTESNTHSCVQQEPLMVKTTDCS